MSVLSNFLGAILKFIYEGLHSLGQEPSSISFYALSLIVMALIQKVLTMPLTFKATKSAQVGQALSGEIKEIQEKYKNDPQNMNAKMMELYKEHDYNPAGGCLPMIIPMILIFAMLAVIRNPAAYIGGGVDNLAKNFFWINDLTQPDKFMLPVIYSLSMFAYTSITQMNQVQTEATQAMNTSMKYVLPIMMLFLSRSWSAGILLFWATSNIVEILVRGLMMLRGGSEKEDVS